jgi:aromatic ring-opening dioxygenase LigB subunit
MSLRLAAILPHPPILIPSVGKENILRLEKTKKSYNKIEAMLAAEEIDTVILISSHGLIRSNVWNINLADEFEINFESFGDFSTKLKINGDLELGQNIRESLIESDQVQAIHNPVLDHGCGVPLYSLLANKKNIKIVPINISGLGLSDHYDFGKHLAVQINKSKKRIAVLASGDLAHTLEKKSPGGFSPRAAKFDQKIIELLQNKSINDFLSLNEELIAEVKPCGLKAIATLLGILSSSGYEINSTDYESPFGVGYLSMILKPLPN